MKNIAIFCDGTWQDFDQPHATNVAKLARATLSRSSAAQGAVQVVRYDDGVGVAHGVADRITRLAGGVFGRGLDYKIARAYEFLCLNYEPGDRIFLFGFSRGAYTVRSLAGLLRQVWILRRDESHRVHEATRIYRARPRKGAPQSELNDWLDDVKGFHKLWCHPSGSAFTKPHKYDPKDPASLAPGTPTECGWIQYMGVWDTVGSLGIPPNLPFADEIDSQYEFHDDKLSRFVRSARQALALDERRRTFAPSIWENVPDLNENAEWSQADYGLRPYQQQWFPGGHGSVGGGGASPVSMAPLLWIAEGAARAGLTFEPGQIARFSDRADPEADYDVDRFDFGNVVLKTVAGLRWRDGPQTLEECSVASRIRWLRSNRYRPRSLERLEAQLGEWTPPNPPMPWFAP